MAMRQKLQGIRKRIIPGGKDMAIRGTGHQADIIKGDIALVDQAESGLSLIFGPVKEPQELALRIPVAAKVIDEFETFLLNFFRQIVQIGEQISTGRAFELELTFEWHPQGADHGQNLNPRQEDPEGRNSQTDNPVSRR